MRIFTLLFLFVTLLQSNALATEKEYYEAIINLQSVEKYFYGTPIYLNKDEMLKSNLRKKMSRIVDIFESFYKTNPKAPDDYRVLFFLGKSYSFEHDLDMTGAWKKSVDCFDKALKIKPTSEEVLLLQGKNYMDSSDSKKALELYERAIQSNPVGRGRLYLALAKISLGRSEEAKDALKKHVEIYPGDEYAKRVLSAVEEGRVIESNK